MKNVTIVVAMMMMAGLSGQGIENSLPGSAGSGKDLVIFTYYRQFIPDLESVTFLSNSKVINATYYNRLKKVTIHTLKSRAKTVTGLLIGFAFDHGSLRDKFAKEIIVPVKSERGQKLYFFPEHRLVITFTGRAHPLPLIRPIIIAESKFSVWLKITL